MTRAQLGAVHAALAELVASWNRAACKGGGRANHALVLIIREDGSGFIGQHFGDRDEDHYDFDDFDGLVRALADGEGVELEE